MNRNIIAVKLAVSGAVITSLLFGGATLALAQSATAEGSVSAETTTKKPTAAETARITKIKDRANQEIDRRIEVLNKLQTRFSEMKKLSSADMQNLANELTVVIGNLTTLKAKINADTDLATLQTDVKSILSSYRVFALVIPRGHIISAADRAVSTLEQVSALANKLDARIAVEKAAGKDTTSLEALMNEVRAKISSAASEAQSAATTVASLVPDNGDKAGMDANAASLKKGRDFVKAATADLQTIKKDFTSIIKTLKTMAVMPSTSSSTPTQ